MQWKKNLVSPGFITLITVLSALFYWLHESTIFFEPRSESMALMLLPSSVPSFIWFLIVEYYWELTPIYEGFSNHWICFISIIRKSKKCVIAMNLQILFNPPVSILWLPRIWGGPPVKQHLKPRQRLPLRESTIVMQYRRSSGTHYSRLSLSKECWRNGQAWAQAWAWKPKLEP